MANDLVTRLLLNSTQFDNNIIKSTKQVQNFQGQAAKMRSGLGSLAKAFTPLAAGIGIAMSAQEAFNKVINSSQTLSDSYNKTMNQGKQVVNEFFYALGSGDFSNFTTGISTIIQLAGDAYESLDKLGNAKISFGYFNMKNQAAFAENEAIAKDKNSTPEQIAQANQNINNILADQSEMVTEYAKKSENAVIDLIEATAGVKLENAGMVNVEKILKNLKQ